MIKDTKKLLTDIKAQNEDSFAKIQKYDYGKSGLASTTITLYLQSVGQSYLSISNTVGINGTDDYENVPIVEFIQINDALKNRLIKTIDEL